MKVMTEALSEYTKQINQEIKDRGLNYKDKEYIRLRRKEHYHRAQMNKRPCSICGVLLSEQTLRYTHKCFFALIENPAAN
jgi:hypothetical protein